MVFVKTLFDESILLLKFFQLEYEYICESLPFSSTEAFVSASSVDLAETVAIKFSCSTAGMASLT